MKAQAPRVVIVDDEADFAALVRRWLSPRYRAVALTDGRDLAGELESGDTSLLVLDVRMPGVDGFELCRRVRADSRYSALPVLFLTGSREEDLYLRNLRAGGTSYLAKPVGRTQLLAAVEALVPEAADEPDTGAGD